MSIVDGSTFDFVHQRGGGNGSGAVVTPDHQRLSSKRKLDDYGPGFEDDDDEYADFSDLVSVRMRKDEPKAVNSLSDGNSNAGNGFMSEIDARVSDARSAGHACSSRSESTRSLMRLQFFIRMMSEGNTMVMQACPQDTVRSIHERIQAVTGIPMFEQRLIYRGKQLQWEQTLADCSIQSDANLQLVGRMRSTEHPQAWQVINDMVSLIWRLCRGEVEHGASKIIRALMTNYLNMTPRDSATGYFQIFISSSVPALLVMLYKSPYSGNQDIADYSIRHFLNSCRTTLSKPLHGQCARVVLELCKLLRGVGSDDPVYLSCRSTLGSLLETAGVSYGSESGQGLVLIQEIFPFVRELANRLMMDLDLSMKSSSGVRPSLNDVHDFAAFLLALRTGITEHEAFKAPFSLNDKKTIRTPYLQKRLNTFILYLLSY